MALVRKFFVLWLLLIPMGANATLVQANLPFSNNGPEGKPITIEWAPPAAKQNGAPIAPNSIGGYRIYVGKSRKQLFPVVDIDAHYVSTYEIAGLSIGTYFIGLTAYDSNGAESKLSNIAQVDVARDSNPSSTSPSLTSIQTQLNEANNQKRVATKQVTTQQSALNNAKSRLKSARTSAQRKSAQNAVNAAQRALAQAQASLAKANQLIAALNDVRNKLVALEQARQRLAQAKNSAQRSAIQKEVNTRLSTLRKAQDALTKVQRSA